MVKLRRCLMCTTAYTGPFPCASAPVGPHGAGYLSVGCTSVGSSAGGWARVQSNYRRGNREGGRRVHLSQSRELVLCS